MHPFVYFPAERRLSPAELSAARLDGHLIELGDGYVPADAIETPGMRGASLAPLLPDTVAAVRLTAAWIHGALDREPETHHVQRATTRRISSVIDRRLVYSDVAIERRHLVRIGGVLVSDATRTLADLARAGTRDPRHREAIERLGAVPGAARRAIVLLAIQDAVPGKRAALSLLRRMEAEEAIQEEVTR